MLKLSLWLYPYGHLENLTEKWPIHKAPDCLPLSLIINVLKISSWGLCVLNEVTAGKSPAVYNNSVDDHNNNRKFFDILMKKFV